MTTDASKRGKQISVVETKLSDGSKTEGIDIIERGYNKEHNWFYLISACSFLNGLAIISCLRLFFVALSFLALGTVTMVTEFLDCADSPPVVEVT